MTEKKTNSLKQEAPCKLNCVTTGIKIIICIQIISCAFTAIMCVPKFNENSSELQALMESSYYNVTHAKYLELKQKINEETKVDGYQTVLFISTIGIFIGAFLYVSLQDKEVLLLMIWILNVLVNWCFHFGGRLYELPIPHIVFLLTIIPYSIGIYLMLILIVNLCKEKEKPDKIELLRGPKKERKIKKVKSLKTSLRIPFHPMEMEMEKV